MKDPFDFPSPSAALLPSPAAPGARPSHPITGAPIAAANPRLPSPVSRRSARKGEVEAEEVNGAVRLLGLEIVGYKRLRAVAYELKDTGLTIIGGLNGSGKSSNLEAVECLFGGARSIPEVPVHQGDPRAKIVARIVARDSGRAYTVRRVILPDRNTQLEVSREDGTAVERPQEFLSAMTGTLWFDPPAFLRQPAKEQAETLRRLVGLDFTELDTFRARLYEQRTQVGRDRDRARGHAESLPFHAGAPESESTPAELVQQLNEATAHNQAVARHQTKVEQGRQYLAGLEGEAARLAAEFDDLREQIAFLTAQLAERQGTAEQARAKATAYREKIDAAEAALSTPDHQPIDTTGIAARLTEVDAVNRKVRENADRAKAFSRCDQFAAEYDSATAEIAALDRQKAEQLAAAQMPVEGLTFSADGLTVLYNDLPLDQASGAEQMRVAVAMAMLMSGGLKICLVDEGEKLDSEQLALLDAAVRDMGGQVLITRVSQGDECDIVITDGAIQEVR